jgi:hypothetical protein
MISKYDPHRFPNVKSYVVAAIKCEETKPDIQLWKGEPTKQHVEQEKVRRTRFLFKKGKTNPQALLTAKRLSACEPGNRCCSGACPECCRLYQRWFVRQSKRLISGIKASDRRLVSITIVSVAASAKPGELHRRVAENVQRQLKYALDETDIDVAIGGLDFSYNEDYEGEYQPFWCPHFYLITGTKDRKALKKQLRKLFKRSNGVFKPVMITSFQNNPKRRSYALKTDFRRRIGYYQKKRGKDGKSHKRRNTRKDRLRAAERLELYIYLDQNGLAGRTIFRGCKPITGTSKVKIAPWP